MQLVSFEIGNEMFAAPISRVQEIIRMPEIVKVPKAPDFVDGVINLRGSVIPVVDLKKKFELNSKTDPDKARIVIVELPKFRVGFIVDAVSEVVETNSDTFEKAPALVSSAHEKFVSGIVKSSESMIMVLDVDHILTNEENDVFESI